MRLGTEILGSENASESLRFYCTSCDVIGVLELRTLLWTRHELRGPLFFELRAAERDELLREAPEDVLRVPRQENAMQARLIVLEK